MRKELYVKNNFFAIKQTICFVCLSNWQSYGTKSGIIIGSGYVYSYWFNFIKILIEQFFYTKIYFFIL